MTAFGDYFLDKINPNSLFETQQLSIAHNTRVVEEWSKIAAFGKAARLITPYRAPTNSRPGENGE